VGSKVTGDEDVTGDLVGMDVSSIVIGDLLGKLVGLEDGLKKAYKRHVYVRRVNFEMTEILLKTHGSYLISWSLTWLQRRRLCGA